MARELKEHQIIERSIIKKYRKELWNPFIEAVKNYEMVNENDTIFLCVTNECRSVLAAKLMQQLQRVSNTHFNLEFKDESGINICEKFAIPTKDSFSENTKEIGLVTFSDVVHKTLKSILYDSSASAYLPIENQKIINPLFCIKQESINAWVNYNNLCFDDENELTENEIKTDELLAELRKTSPDIEHSIFKSVHAVCLDTMIGYTQDDKHHTFLEKF